MHCGLHRSAELLVIKLRNRSESLTSIKDSSHNRSDMKEISNIRPCVLGAEFIQRGPEFHLAHVEECTSKQNTAGRHRKPLVHEACARTCAVSLGVGIDICEVPVLDLISDLNDAVDCINEFCASEILTCCMIYA